MADRDAWHRPDRYYEQRGDYRVSAARVAEQRRFSAWRREGKGWAWLGTFDTAGEAKGVCGEGSHDGA